MKNLKKWVVRFAMGILLSVLVAFVLVSRSQGINAVTNYPEDRDMPEKTPADFGLAYEDVTVTTPDGLKLVGWYIPSENGAVVMAQHGYKAHREWLLEEAEMLHHHGYGALLTTVRAHDASEGNLISFGVYEMQDLEAWYQYLLTRPEVDAGKIGILGNSMGGYLAIEYAAQNENIQAVVTHSAFSSMNDTISTSVTAFTGLPAFPFAPMMVFWAEQKAGIDADELNAKNWIADISPRPVFLLQGGQDSYISSNSGQLLYEAAQEPKELWFEPELDHVEFDRKMPALFEERVIGFFDQYLLQDTLTQSP